MAKAGLAERERIHYEAFLSELLSSGSEAEILEHLQSVDVPEPYRLSVKAIYCRQDPLTVLRALGRESGLKALNGIGSFSISPSRHLNARRAFHFVALKADPTSDSQQIRTFLAISTRSDWDAFVRWLNHQYPDLVPVYLTQGEMISTAMSLRDTTKGFTVRVRESTARERVEGRSGRQERSIREWTDETLEQVVRRAVDRGRQIRSIRLAFFQEIRSHVAPVPTAQCRLTTDGIVEIAGDFGLAHQRVVAHVACLGQRKLSLYANRGMRESHYKPAPLTIRFDQPVFHEVEEVRLLVSKLSAYPQSMHSIQHGNPYAHLQIADGYDGSSFDIWAASEDSLMIIPRLKASEASINRLIHFVMQHYREGKVIEQPNA